MSILQTPLHGAQSALGCKRAPFAGYDMAVFFSGIYDEAAAVRTGCGMFDVSHMARLEFAAGAEPFLQKLLTCDVSKIQPGAGSYGLVLNDDGGILDDIILYRKPAGDFLLVANASNHDKIVRWIQSHGGTVRDITADTAMIAVQGPKSEAILSEVIRCPNSSGGMYRSLAEFPYFGGSGMAWSGEGPVWISRTGYTGEDGFELVCPAGGAEKIWNWLLNAGRVAPCGLGARDVLRVEAGYSLYGSDMDETASPYDCGLGFAVARGLDFWGAAALTTRPVRSRMVGLDAGDQPSAIMRHGYPILSEGARVGEVKSGVYSRTLSRSVAFGLIAPAVPEDAPLSVEIRGRAVPVRRVSRRFIQGRVRSRAVQTS